MLELLRKFWRQNSDDNFIYSLTVGVLVVVITVALFVWPISSIPMNIVLGVVLRQWWDDFQIWKQFYGGRNG